MPNSLGPQWRDRYGPWAVITGASDGIGRAFAHRLAEAGVNLVLVARREAVLQTLASDLRLRYRTDVNVASVDLTPAEGTTAVLHACENLDVGLLVASAGFGTSGPFVESALAEELSMIDVNCRAVAALTHGFARRFEARRRGGIVLMSSLVAFQGVPRSANYAATKAYIQSLAEGLRIELKPLGIDVLACAPGPIQSGFGARARMTMGLHGTPEMVASETLQALGKKGIVRPGWLSKLLEFSLMWLPRWGRTLVLKQVMGSMTRG